MGEIKLPYYSLTHKYFSANFERQHSFLFLFLNLQLFDGGHHRCSLDLLGHVVPRLRWSQIVESYTRYELPEIVSQLHSCLLLLLVRLNRSSDLIKVSVNTVNSVMFARDLFGEFCNDLYVAKINARIIHVPR